MRYLALGFGCFSVTVAHAEMPLGAAPPAGLSNLGQALSATCADDRAAIATSHLRQTAQAITVKIWVADNNWGSGVLIARQGTIYTVLTNRHVLTAGQPSRIETADGRHHWIINSSEFTHGLYDIGLVQFRSSNIYEIARLSSTSVVEGEVILAAGYPIFDDPSQPPEFTAIFGTVGWITPNTMAGGYQIGADLAIAKGMSGGPVLNAEQELVGINGLHQYPLWGNPYIFDDGSIPPLTQQQQMQHYSWAIPLRIILQSTPIMR